MRIKAITIAVLLICICVSPTVAAEEWREWDPAAMQWVSLGLGITAGIAVDWVLWTFSFGGSFDEDDLSEFRRLAIHKLPTAAVGMVTSVLVMNAYFRLTTFETDQLGVYLLRGTLIGGVGGLTALATSYVADAVFASIAHKDLLNPSASNFTYQWVLSGITGAISAGLGLVTSGILYIVLE